MGKKEQQKIKVEQSKITFEIYFIPETLTIIQQIITEVHSTEYTRDFEEKNGRKKKSVVFPPMENPQLMLGKYLYILHYLIRRLLQFRIEYKAEGFGISTRELRKRIGVDDSTVSLMMYLMEKRELIQLEKRHSTFKRTSKKIQAY